VLAGTVVAVAAVVRGLCDQRLRYNELEVSGPVHAVDTGPYYGGHDHSACDLTSSNEHRDGQGEWVRVVSRWWLSMRS
jgi:hypothetical protein